MNILVSVYACNPYGVSEAYSGFRWIEILSRKYNVTVVTPLWWVDMIEKYYFEKGEKIPFELIPVKVEHNFFEHSKLLNYVVKARYFLFNYYAYKVIKGLDRKFDCILHRNPVGIRYPNKLCKLGSKLILGPLSGGLNIPKEMKSIRKKDRLSVFIRKADKLWFLLNPALRRTYRKADKILISGDYLRDIIPGRYNDKLVNMFETGIDTDSFIVNKDTGNGTVKLLFIGRLVHYKGLELLLKSLAIVRKKHTNFTLDVLGDGPSKTDCMKLCNDLGLKPHVFFRGRVNFEEVRNFLAQCDIFCFPSLKEAAGNVFLEAMASGKPIVCANIGGPKEILDAKCSIRVDIKDEEQFINEMAGDIEKLLMNKSLRRKLGERARERVERLFDWRVMEKNIYSFFDSLN